MCRHGPADTKINDNNLVNELSIPEYNWININQMERTIPTVDDMLEWGLRKD